VEMQCDVHHRLPIEYAHLEPEFDINQVENLVAVHEEVHDRISAVWNRLRVQKTKVTDKEVHEVMEIVDRHFNRWYDAIIKPETVQSEIQMAEQSALAEIEQLIARMENP